MKKFLAILLSIVMLLSMGVVGFSAFAADEEEDEAYIVSFDSIMNLSSNAISAPNATYTYTLTSGDGGKVVTYENDWMGTAYETYDSSVTLEVGDIDSSGTVTDVFTFSEGVLAENQTIAATAEFTTGDYATSNYTVTKEVELDLSGIEFTEPGVYHYVIKETITEEVDGLYSDSYIFRDVLVTVTYVSADSDEVEISNTTMYLNWQRVTTDSVIADLDEDERISMTKSDSFTHSYGLGYDYENDGGTIGTNYYYEAKDAGEYGQDFIVSLTAFGNMASTTKEFMFATVTANVADGTVFEVVDGDKVSQYIVQTENGLYFADANNDYAATTDVFTVDLSDGQEYSILSVVEGMEFTVTISDSSYDGYSYYYRDYEDASTTEYGGEIYRGDYEDNRRTVTLTATIDGEEYESWIYAQAGTGYELPDWSYAYYTLSYWTDGTTEYDVGELYTLTDGATLTAVFERVEWQSGSIYTQTIDDVYADSLYINDAAELMMYDDVEIGLNIFSTDNEGIDFAVVKGQDLDEDDDSDNGITYDGDIANTGVILEIAPYALMVLLAAAFVVLRAMSARKKQWA